MNYQLLVLDLDGTLTNSKKEVSQATLEALIDIQRHGKKVVLASGRPTKGVAPLAELLRLHEFGSYILSFNGGRITDCRNSQIIYEKMLPDDIAEPLYDIARKYSDIDIITYTPDHLISGLHTNQYSKLEASINRMPIIHADDFPSQVPESMNKILITGNPETICRAKDEIIGYFHSYLSVYRSDPFFLEIMPRGIDKAHSLLRLLSGIGLTTDEMICCGDGYNDLTMIETAGLGVAMANAQPAVLKAADYITKSNDEDGVLHVINKFMR